MGERRIDSPAPGDHSRSYRPDTQAQMRGQAPDGGGATLAPNCFAECHGQFSWNRLATWPVRTDFSEEAFGGSLKCHHPLLIGKSFRARLVPRRQASITMLCSP